MTHKMSDNCCCEQCDGYGTKKRLNKPRQDLIEPRQDFIDQYNILLETLVRLNIIHPETPTRMECPEGRWNANPSNLDYVNRVVERVVRLRTSGVNKGAKAVVDKGIFDDDNGTFFYRCVCLRSDGTKENPSGEEMK